MQSLLAQGSILDRVRRCEELIPLLQEEWTSLVESHKLSFEEHVVIECLENWLRVLVTETLLDLAKLKSSKKKPLRLRFTKNPYPGESRDKRAALEQ